MKDVVEDSGEREQRENGEKWSPGLARFGDVRSKWRRYFGLGRVSIKMSGHDQGR